MMIKGADTEDKHPETLHVDMKKISVWLESYAPDIVKLGNQAVASCINDLLACFELKPADDKEENRSTD